MSFLDNPLVRSFDLSQQKGVLLCRCPFLEWLAKLHHYGRVLGEELAAENGVLDSQYIYIYIFIYLFIYTHTHMFLLV